MKNAQYAYAEERYRISLFLNKQSSSTWLKLGFSLNQQGRIQESIDCYHKALSINETDAETHYKLGNSYRQHNELKKAKLSYKRAIEINPLHAKAHNNLGITLSDLCEPELEEECYRKAIEIDNHYQEANNNLLFFLATSPEIDPDIYLAAANNFGAKLSRNPHFEHLQKNRKSCNRIRVGFVSGDLRKHPVGYFIESTVKEINKNEFLLFAYTTNDVSDELTRGIRGQFEEFRSLTMLNDDLAAELIYSDQLDILIDLSGHTSGNRLSLFTYKPAPIQATWLGYFASTGIREIDYILVDEAISPKEYNYHYSEKQIYIEGSRFCFTKPKTTIFENEPQLANRQFTFGSFQNIQKINGAVLDSWAEIMAQSQNSILRLQCPQFKVAETKEIFFNKLKNSGIPINKVSFHPPTDRESYLLTLSKIDLIIDTFPYPGGTTTCEALWMGTPTVTLMGNTLLSRQGAAILAAAGLADFVAFNKNEYIKKAVDLSNNPEALASIKNHIKTSVKFSPLFDSKIFTRSFERALRNMLTASVTH
jgi:predicted O-linked N-acetylglucosamine transferase (SPINDLY family)